MKLLKVETVERTIGMRIVEEDTLYVNPQYIRLIREHERGGKMYTGIHLGSDEVVFITTPIEDIIADLAVEA